MEKCVLCDSNAIINRQESASRTIYNCRDCGVFVVSDLVEKDIKRYSCEIMSFLASRKLAKKNDTVLISFEKANLDKDYLQLTVGQIADRFPESFSEQMDMALKNLEYMSPFAGYEIKIDNLKLAPLFYVRKNCFEALTFAIKAMQRADLIEVNYFNGSYFPCGVTISPNGWDRLWELKQGESLRETMFCCAPRNENDITRTYDKVVNKISGDRKLHVVYNHSENAESRVCFELIAGVKAANLVICDFTEFSGEMYYAAALAAGLGKPCMITCHKSARKKLQIDTHQFSVIFWDSQESLYLELSSAIAARM